VRVMFALPGVRACVCAFLSVRQRGGGREGKKEQCSERKVLLGGLDLCRGHML